MKKIMYHISLWAVLAAMLVSCSDFLDRQPTDYSTTGFYRSEEAIRDGAAGVYHLLNAADVPGFYNIPFTVALDHFTALALERTENTTIGAGTLNPDVAAAADLWTRFYKLITRANSVIDGSKPYIDGLNAAAKQYVAEARVLRAFAYYYLIATFGDVLFYTAPVTVEQYEDARTDRAVILDFILQDMESAAGDLPWKATARGRVDRATAYALAARAALLGGSLNYGGKGADYFAKAAENAGKVIGQRGLAKKFDDLFCLTGQATDEARNELLFELMYSSVAGSQKNHIIGFGQVSRNTGQTSRHVSMLLYDMYECIDGKRIDESPLYDPTRPQKNRDPRLYSTLWMHGDSVRVVGTGGDRTQKLDAYNNQCPFLNNTTGLWEMKDNFDVNSAVHPAAWASFCNAGSGYVWAKFSNETAENISSQTCNVPVIRYAEVLLTYAEAKIELNQLDESVYSAIDAVRVRAGMPVVSSDRKGDRQKMLQLVRRERKVEFALEGLHFVDIRRWGIGDLLAGPSYGLPFPRSYQQEEWLRNNPGKELADMPESAVVNGYTLCTPDMVPNFKKTDRHDLNDVANYDAYKDRAHLKVRDARRTWKEAYNLWPIPQIERLRNPNLSQNDGY